MTKPKQWSMEWAGKTLTIEVGKYAAQADAAVTCKYGDTEVLATVATGAPRDGVDYFPLMVDYEEKFYAAGKIKGSRFIKREGRPTDEAVLVARMIDRSIRPLFNQSDRSDVQVIITVFSHDGNVDPDIPSLIAASTALSISPIDWKGPISGMRVGRVDGKLVLNPGEEEQGKTDMDVVAVHTGEDKLIMLETEANEATEKDIQEALTVAKKHNIEVLKFISGIQKEIGKEKVATDDADHGLEDAEFKLVDEFLTGMVGEAVFKNPKASKKERYGIYDDIKEKLETYLSEQEIGKEKREKAGKLVKEYVEAEVSRALMEEGKRVDGRELDEIRELTMEVGMFARTHGSGHFMRGETQVASIVTLGSPGDAQLLDTMELSDVKKHYMHHYNFPPFSVGEAGPLRGPGRRDIGHGALAEKAIEAVLPAIEDFPYTIRVVSEVLSSNGSSSMASTCGSSLSLMDAGVPLKSHVAGIAMGLASNEEKGKYVVFADLQDVEDGEGGMDFKICGTKDGITAIQLDTKTLGIPDKVIAETFTKARAALNTILEKMNATIPEARKELSQHAPRIHKIMIDPEKIGLVIGPGGKTINRIIEETGVDIDIEKDGTVLITAVDKDGGDDAVKQVNELTREIEVGDEFEGEVVRIMDFGAFVQLTPSIDGMVHVSNLSNEYVEDINKVVKVGDKLKVKVREKDDQGRINLIVDGVEAKPQERRGGGGGSRPPHRGGPGGGGGRGGGGFDRGPRRSGGPRRDRKF